MPPKPNGFYMFMLAEQKKLKSLTNRVPSMRELPGICRDPWKKLSAEEKAKYEAQAKREKERLQSSGETAKLDCHRQVIADRVDPVKEDLKRRKQERQTLLTNWRGQDPRDIVFHILDFQVMYDDLIQRHHFPVEIGMVSFTLRKGLMNFMHRFINPGEVPQGNRHLAVSHSENTHKIPLNFEHGDSNFKALTTHMSLFLKSDSEDELPPIFCLNSHRSLIENCLNFIYDQVCMNEFNKIQKVYCLEDLVTCLITNTGREEKSIVESQVRDMLCQNRWDHNSSIKCSYHEELDCSFCSLSIARRYSFAVFDILSILLQFELTDKHMPDETEQNYTVTESIGFGRQSHSMREERWQNRDNNNKETAYSNRNRYQPGGRENAWQPPRVDSVKVPVEDDDSEEEDEVKSQPTELRQLRLPKSLAQVQSQVGQMSIQPGAQHNNLQFPRSAMPMSNQQPIPGVNPAMVRNAGPIRPMGRGMVPPKMGQARPVGRGWGTPGPPPGFVSPPPGFGPRPGLPMGATAGVAGPSHMSLATSDEHFPALSRGRARGRALLPN